MNWTIYLKLLSFPSVSNVVWWCCVEWATMYTFPFVYMLKKKKYITSVVHRTHALYRISVATCVRFHWNKFSIFIFLFVSQFGCFKLYSFSVFLCFLYLLMRSSVPVLPLRNIVDNTRHRLWFNQNIMLISTLNMKIRKIWNSFELVRLCMLCTSVYPKRANDTRLMFQWTFFSVVFVQC